MLRPIVQPCGFGADSAIFALLPALTTISISRRGEPRALSKHIASFVPFSSEYLPCFVTARQIRSVPSGVRGPVLIPPWFL
jgi:hypothetical protein